MAWPGTRFSIRRCCACDEQAPQGCTLLSDTFDTDLNNFTEVSGTWEVAGGLLQGSGVGSILANNEPDLPTDGINIATTVQRTGGDPATLRLFGGYDDANNYLFGEFNYDVSGVAGTIRVGQRVGGIETWLSEEIELEDDTELADAHNMEFCWKPPQPQEQRQGFAASGPFESSGTGWTDPGNIFEEDLAVAAEFVFGAGTTSYLHAFNFNFGPIPPGSTIDGIEVGYLSLSTAGPPAGGRLSSLRLRDSTGAFVGDDKGTGQVVNTVIGTYVGVGAGGPDDDWNAGLTFDDIQSDNFGCAAQFACDASTQFEVDFVVITVWYTTPAMTRGRVMLTYQNTEGGAIVPIACAIGFTDYEATDKQAGIGIITGDWSFTHFTLSYLDSPTHTPCPDCECVAIGCSSCSTSDPASSTYIVDLGVGGFTDGECDSCEAIAGEYALELAIVTGGGQGWCIWEYEETLDCGATLRLELFLGGTEPGMGELFTLAVTVAQVVDGVFHGAMNAYILAKSFPVLCQAEAPFTLDKWLTFYEGSPAACEGELPATVTVDIP